MCDGWIDDTAWTIHRRDTNQPLESADGYTYIFSEESAAESFLSKRLDATNLEIVAVHTSETV